MHYAKVALGVYQPLGAQNVAVLKAQIVLLVEEALPLHTGHIQHIQPRQRRVKIGGLHKINVVFFQDIPAHIIGKLKLAGGYQHKAHALVSGKRGYEGMYGAPEFKVAAEAHGDIAQLALFFIYCEHIGKRLRGVVVSAVPGVYNGHGGIHGGHQGRALLIVPHGDYIGKAGDNLCGIRHAFPLGGRRALRIGKAQNIAAQLIHCRLKAQAGAGGGLVKESGQLFAAAAAAVFIRLRHDVAGGVNQLLDFLL